jgi:hypothetical protein
MGQLTFKDERNSLPLVPPGQRRDQRTFPMTMTVPFSEHLSEKWLLERTYYAQWEGTFCSRPHSRDAAAHLSYIKTSHFLYT